MRVTIKIAYPKQGDLQDVVLWNGTKVTAYKQPLLMANDLVEYIPQGFGCASIKLIDNNGLEQKYLTDKRDE